MSLWVKNLDGTPVNLSDQYRGKFKALLFYNNACLGCTGRALPLAYELKKEFPDIEVAAIHCDFSKRETTREEILSIFTIDELPFSIFRDIDLNLYQRFECEGTPHWILLNENDEVVNSIFGSQQGAQTRLAYAFQEITQ